MKNVVYNCDCLPEMRKMPDNAFDLAIVDPPYGGVKQGGYMKNKCRTSEAMWQNDYCLDLWKQSKPSQEYFDELFRVSKNQIIFGWNNYPAEIGRQTQSFIVWDKKRAEGVKFAECELAYTSFESAARIFAYKWDGFMQEDMKNKEVRIHPTQKPVALYSWILKNYAEPGMTILDTHVGSGSIRIACYDMGFDFTGYEISKEYYDLQEERFRNHSAQLNLFLMEDNNDKEGTD